MFYFWFVLLCNRFGELMGLLSCQAFIVTCYLCFCLFIVLLFAFGCLLCLIGGLLGSVCLILIAPGLVVYGC